MEKQSCPDCDTINLANARFCSGCGHELPKQQMEIPAPIQQTTNKQTTDDRKKRIKRLAGVAGFFIAYFAVQQLFFKTPSFDKQMMQVASELNKTCPIMVDRYTRLDNAIALPDNIFQYNYTLVENEKAEVNIDTVKKYVEPGIINNVKTNPDLKIFRDHGTTMNYKYCDKNGVFVLKISVTPNLYR